jgi:hypothetical protein
VCWGSIPICAYILQNPLRSTGIFVALLASEANGARCLALIGHEPTILPPLSEIAYLGQFGKPALMFPKYLLFHLLVSPLELEENHPLYSIVRI